MPTPKEVAEKQISQRVITKEQAKADYIKWIDNALKTKHTNEVVAFWEEVKKEVEKL